MHVELTPEQATFREAARAFAQMHVEPRAEEIDRMGEIDEAVFQALAREKWLAGMLPAESRGAGLDYICYGLLAEAISRASLSVAFVLTAHGMVAEAIGRFGTAAQRERWLPAMGGGEVIGAFALSEAGAGSDAQSISSTATRTSDGYVLNGCKAWISLGQVAGLFIVFAKCDGRPTAFLVPAALAVTVTPVNDMICARGAMLANVAFQECLLPADSVLGSVGGGIQIVATRVLVFGRYSVAWASVGIAQACCALATAYASERVQFGVPIERHQLVQAKLTQIITGTRAARLLCYRAGHVLNECGHEGLGETMVAKYFASRNAAQAATETLHLHGAAGCRNSHLAARLLRDSTSFEIIEGTSEVHQMVIPRLILGDL